MGLRTRKGSGNALVKRLSILARVLDTSKPLTTSSLGARNTRLLAYSRVMAPGAGSEALITDEITLANNKVHQQWNTS